MLRRDLFSLYEVASSSTCVCERFRLGRFDLDGKRNSAFESMAAEFGVEAVEGDLATP